MSGLDQGYWVLGLRESQDKTLTPRQGLLLVLTSLIVVFFYVILNLNSLI
jgi:hypothetical protein